MSTALYDRRDPFCNLLTGPTRSELTAQVARSQGTPDIEPIVFRASASQTGDVATSQRVQIDGKRFSRGGVGLRVQGVTYGPFAPNCDGDQLPEPDVVARDFRLMRAGGVNAIRIYHAPPGWFLDLADECGILMLIDIPCPKHLGFLENRKDRRAAREHAAAAVKSVADRACVLGCSIGNEIPPDIVRWYGPTRIEKVLKELTGAAKQADANMLVTYGNYPRTEYLELPFLDFRTFNVYLHDRATFRRYLLRLANQTCDKPLLLGEIGMDTLRNGEASQAEFLAGHTREVALLGLAGCFVFAWTDDWFTHGYQIDDWAFGITKNDRSPKAAYSLLSEVFQKTPAQLLEQVPRVSVVVCSYNGGTTLEKCLKSLEALNYPDYEVILVDDGSTDDTPAIAARFPNVRTIRHENHGLSYSRNVGLEAATGEIVAYTDSDCFADPDWLAVLVHELQVTNAAGVGGPNLTPDDGWLAACVAASPGQPTHVLVSDDDAEHVPGCNMAFRRQCLRDIGGFDPLYCKAGDDVDICWRLQAEGHSIAFAPCAFVWHHRRQNPRAFLKQQAGYGEAEALLARRHPNRFSLLGGSKWRGAIYGDSLVAMRLGSPCIHGGLFGQGLFQTLYRASPAYWTMLPATLEWQTIALVFAALGIFNPLSLWCAGGMFLLTVLVVAIQAVQARPAARYDGLSSRAVIALLCWLQPLVRSGQRYRSRWTRRAVPPHPSVICEPTVPDLRPVSYITLNGVDKSRLMFESADQLRRQGWDPVVDSGWSPYDMDIPCTPGHRLLVRSVQEWYGGDSAQIRLTYRLCSNPQFLMAGIALDCGVIAAAVAMIDKPTVVDTALLACALLATAIWFRLGWLSLRSARGAASIIDAAAKTLGMTVHEPRPAGSEA